MDAKTFFDPNFDIRGLGAFPNLPARKQLIWLASFPKSGNTWMRLFMSAYLSGKDTADINEDLQENYQCNNPRLAAFVAQKPVEEFSATDNLRVRVPMQRLFARNPEKLFIKTHVAVSSPQGHPSFDAASTAASIHICRNPLAVLPSYARHMGLELNDAIHSMANKLLIQGDVANGIPASLTSSWSAFTRSWIGASALLNVITVRYEDMKAKPIETFGRVLGHISVSVDQDKLQTALGATEFDKLKAQDISKGFKERTKADKAQPFFRSGKVDGWRTELEPAHIEATIRNHWDAMSQLDYIPADYVPFYEEVKFKELEEMVSRGIDIGVYAAELNELRAKRGIQQKLAINTAKKFVRTKEARKNKKASRPTRRKTFG